MQAEMALSAHTSPNQPHEHMIPSQLLDNEVFLGCKRRGDLRILSFSFKRPLKPDHVCPCDAEPIALA